MAEMIELKCDNCGVLFDRKAYDHRSRTKQGFQNVYCSARCGWDSKKGYDLGEIPCATCETPFLRSKSSQIFCSKSCINLRESYTETTIGDLKQRYPANRVSAKIRGLARAAYNNAKCPMVCFACGYSRGIDICHIRAVADFPDDTPIDVINDPSNLMALDKLCHWEYDNGFLEFE